MREISKNQQMALNIASSIIVFGVNMIISFFLSPYIVATLGVEANGFVQLANNFISYVTLITIAVNSMAGRFITIKLHQNDMECASMYYTSVFIGNLTVVILLLVPTVFCIYHLEKLINIPSPLILDVKILFSLIFINFFISTGTPKWDTASFAQNKLYLQSMTSIAANLVKVAIVIGLFLIFQPAVYFLGIAAFVSTLILQGCAAYFKQKLIPQMKIGMKYFNLSAIKELVMSGIWNTLTSVGQILSNGLDLLIANLFIGSLQMGVLSLAKMIPNVLLNLGGTLQIVFAPSLTISYAKNDTEEMKKDLNRGMKLTGVLLTIPVSILIIFGDKFFSLWVPSQNAFILHWLSILSCLQLVFTSGIQCLYNVFTVVNKVKDNSITLLVSGAVSTIIVLVLLKTTNLGIFAVASVSTFVLIIRNLVYTVPFAAIYLNMKWTTFFPEVGHSVVSVGVIVALGYILKSIFPTDTWMSLIIVGAATGLIGLLVNLFIVLNKNERKLLRHMLLRRRAG